MKREFLSTNEVAELLGISPFTIRRYIQFRKLKAVKLEGGYRVRRTDLDRFLKAREIETEEELGEQAEGVERIPVPRRPSKTERSDRPTKRNPTRPQTRSERARSSGKATGRE